jgi:NADH:ubiquinone oxidoreductase subunit 4 (subunit M)
LTGLSALTLESRSYRRVYAFLVMFAAGCTATLGIYAILNLSRNSAGTLWITTLLGTVAVLVKTPAFPFSLWLPEAHVEASWAGSVGLAAFALKFATFASALFVVQHLIRHDSIEAILFFSVWLSAIAIAASVDIKKLIANFSILHMSGTLLFLAFTPYAEFYPNFSWHHHSIVTGIFFVLVGFAYASSGSRLVRLFLSNRDSVPLLLLSVIGLFTVSLDLP